MTGRALRKIAALGLLGVTVAGCGGVWQSKVEGRATPAFPLPWRETVVPRPIAEQGRLFAPGGVRVRGAEPVRPVERIADPAPIPSRRIASAPTPVAAEGPLGMLAPIAGPTEILDVAKELAYPGTRMVVVEFYSLDCAPCMAAVPKWKALHKKFRSAGLRFIVVKAMDDGRCVSLDWSPDRSICDEDDIIQKTMRVNAWPKAFAWSWTGELLVNGGHVQDVEQALEAELVRMPRAVLHTIGAGKDYEETEKLVRAELNRSRKIQVVADAQEQKAIEAIRRASRAADVDERSECC